MYLVYLIYLIYLSICVFVYLKDLSLSLSELVQNSLYQEYAW